MAAGPRSAAPGSAAPRAGGPALTSPPDIIVCFLDVTNPRGPSTLSGVEASALVLCSWPVDFISVSVDLFRGNTLVASIRRTVPLAIGWGVTASTPCVSGRYFAIATGEVDLPSGYFPPFLSAVIASGSVDITCGPAPNPNAQAPFGALDVAEITPDGRVHVAGWAINPASASTPAYINLFPAIPPDDRWGYTFGGLPADLNRPDVGAASPQFGPNHGFDRYSPNDIAPSLDPENPGQFIFPGNYDLCAYATTGFATTLLGCRRIHLTQEILSEYWP